jgi:hypothetical protein
MSAWKFAALICLGAALAGCQPKMDSDERKTKNAFAQIQGLVDQADGNRYSGILLANMTTAAISENGLENLTGEQLELARQNLQESQKKLNTALSQYQSAMKLAQKNEYRLVITNSERIPESIKETKKALKDVTDILQAVEQDSSGRDGKPKETV